MTLPDILEQAVTGHSTRIVFRAAESLRCFDGHFPGFPVLPGVVQIGWAVALAERSFGRQLDVSGMRRVKFVRLIRPDIDVTLDIAINESGDRLEFRYHDSEGDYSSGSLLLGAAP